MKFNEMSEIKKTFVVEELTPFVYLSNESQVKRSLLLTCLFSNLSYKMQVKLKLLS
jgi:hypothetical protein